MIASIFAKASSCRRRSGESARISRSAGSSFSGVQSSCRNSGTTFSPITRLARMTELTLDHAPHDPRLDARRPCRRRPSARRQARVRASRCPTWPVPHARSGTPPAFPASPTTIRGCTGQLFTPSRDRFLQMRHGGQDQFERHALAPAAGPASRRRPPCDAGSRCGGFPAAPAAPAAPASRRCLLLGIRAAARRSARSGDGRHSCRADRAACDMPPARTAAAPARDRHSGASRAPGPAATPRPRARHNRRSGSRDRGRARAGPRDG